VNGYRRANGRVGARNHVLVLPSVVCSVLAAQRIATDGAVSIGHQHGCGEVGDDAEHTRAVFEGVASNPNVAATLVVGLGCETVQGKALAVRLADRGLEVRYAGIQAEGGTERTVERGRELLRELADHARSAARDPVRIDELTIGLDDAAAPFADDLDRLVRAGGATLVVAEGGRGFETHADLAAAGAQIIVSWCDAGEGPLGFVVCPVIAVSGDPELFAALRDDFDLDGTGDPAEVAAAVWARVAVTFDGQQTASERRGAVDFSLRRLARTM
jgi:altronate dehydratase large subunit